MTDPMSDERLADRRKKIEAEHVERRYFYGAECSCGECLPCVVLADELAWLDGVERLREQLAAFVPPGALGAGETPALCGTCKDRLCVPGLPGCARCVKAGLAETTHALEVTGEKVTALRKQRDQAEGERDEAREQVKRVREVAACLRRHEANLKERYDKATNDARATALLSSAALTGDAAHRIERALGGTEPGQ